MSDNFEHTQSYYAASRNSAALRPILQGAVSCDVAVIGGGFTGLSTALALAEKGYKVALVESRLIGWGASGRNGGQALNGLGAGREKTESIAGMNTAKIAWDITVEAVNLIKQRIKKYSIECDWRDGHVFAAVKASHLPEMIKDAEILAKDYGYDQQSIIKAADMKAHINSERYCGGIFDAGCGHFHPLNYVLGLAKAAENLGVVIYEKTKAIRLTTNNKPVVYTEHGELRCNYIVLAANTDIKSLSEKLAHNIMPAGTFMLATEVLGRQVVNDLMPSDACVCDSNFVLDYFRRSADHRILFGGGVSYSATTPPALSLIMQHRLSKSFPQLATSKIDYVWSGLVDITMNRLPDFGRINKHIYYAQGFSGHGVALTGMAGQLIADAVAGSAERLDIIAKIPHIPFPGGTMLRMPLLVLGMLWYRLRDLLS